jgi:tRNA(Ile)-lysidine synthase
MATIDDQVLGFLDLFFSEEEIDRTEAMAVAFSGGSDSLALLCALTALLGNDDIDAFYVNHHLRPAAELEAEIARNEENCRTIGVRFTLIDLGKGAVATEAKRRGRGIEEAARQLRYEALARACRERSIPYLLTGHNSDDQLETLLMRIGQGSSLSALGGIRRTRDLGGVMLLRPMLEVTHAELAEYAADKGLVWSQDSTNREDRYLRNALRSQVKKPLLSLFPNAHQAAYTLTTRFQHVSRLLEQLTDTAMAEVTSDDGVVLFALRWYLTLEPALRELVIYRMAALLIGSDDRISRMVYYHIAGGIEEILRGEWTVREMGNLRMRYKYGTVIITTIEPSWSFCMSLSDPTTTRSIPISDHVALDIRTAGRSSRYPNALKINATALKAPVIRSVLASDVIALEGGTMRVNKLLSAMGISSYQRPLVPVLVDQSGVVAVFAAALGGRDRIAVRFKAPLAHGFTNIYSSNRRDIYSEDE